MCCWLCVCVCVYLEYTKDVSSSVCVPFNFFKVPSYVNYSALLEIKIKERFQKRQALTMWLKGHEKDFLEWMEDILGVVYAYMVFWNSEHLGASRVRLLCLLRLQRTPLKKFQIENHRKDLGPLNPYFPEGLKRPRDRPKATERLWAF